MRTQWTHLLVRTMRPFGAIFRSLLKSMPESTVVPILSGPLKGFRWLLHSGVGGYWLGTYEPAQEKILCALIKPGMVCYDCGANVGHYTLLFSRLVGPTGKVIAFEPVPTNIAFLKKHVTMNQCSNVIIEEIALTNHDGTERICSANSMSKIDPGGDIAVTCHKIDSLDLPPPELMKIDIEGAEIDMLAGAESVIRSYHPTIVLSLHISQESARKCEQWFESLGYVVTRSQNRHEIYATHSSQSSSKAVQQA